MVSETLPDLEQTYLAEEEALSSPDSDAAPEVPNTTDTGDSDTEPSAGGKDGESPDSASSAGEAEQGQKPEDSDDFDAAISEVTGVKPEAEPEGGAELPGRSVEDVATAVRNQAATTYASTMQGAEAEFRARRTAEGFSAAQIDALWQDARKPLVELHNTFEDYNLVTLDRVLRDVLNEDEVKAYEKRDLLEYDKDGNLLPVASRRNGLKAVLALREQSIHAEYKAKLEKGEILTKAQARDLYQKGVAKGEKTRESARSGETPNGATRTTPLTDDELDNMTNEELIAAGYA